MVTMVLAEIGLGEVKIGRALYNPAPPHHRASTERAALSPESRG